MHCTSFQCTEMKCTPMKCIQQKCSDIRTKQFKACRMDRKDLLKCNALLKRKGKYSALKVPLWGIQQIQEVSRTPKSTCCNKFTWDILRRYIHTLTASFGMVACSILISAGLHQINMCSKVCRLQNTNLYIVPCVTCDVCVQSVYFVLYSYSRLGVSRTIYVNVDSPILGFPCIL